VDTDYFTPLPKLYKIHREIGIPLDSLLIGNISRISEGKGHNDLIFAAEAVVKKVANAFFLIVGDDFNTRNGTMRTELMDLAGRLNIKDRVVFTGWRTDIRDVLQDIDIFVHCPDTWREGMGIATLEAVACGKPVVITNNSGLAETVRDGFNGFVVPIGDRDSISQRIITLLSNDKLRKEFGDNSRIYAEENFNIKENIKKIERVLKDLYDR